MEYIMGNNPMDRAYIVGYDLEKGASHPHHRAAHGSKTLNMDEPADQTHVLWGALVGGPDANDYHRDITKDFINITARIREISRTRIFLYRKAV